MAFSVSEIAAWVSGEVVNAAALGPGLDRIRVERPAELGRAGPSEIAFFFNRAYQAELLKSSPGILITAPAFVEPIERSGLPLWRNSAIVCCPDPYLAMALISEKAAVTLSSVAHPDSDRDASAEPEVHPTAIVHSKAQLGLGVTIGPYCIVEEGASIGEGTILYAGCHVGPRCVIGQYCVLFSRVTLYEWTEVGDRVRLHAGVVLGADGFGYAPRRAPSGPMSHQKIYHLGKVVIGDDVEIGANTCIDRATLGETRVERGAKIDDLVMIGHNCRIEEGAIICGKAGLSGRAHIGKYAIVGGGAGICNDVHVGDGSSVAALTLVSKDVPAGTTVVGNPQRGHKEHFRIQALMNRLLRDTEARKS